MKRRCVVSAATRVDKAPCHGLRMWVTTVELVPEHMVLVGLGGRKVGYHGPA